ncbi:uncharacterized protein LOC113862137 [Abrus precatorius]|uniref:Uncharacterized protein LOC113862137 n=1 Tax=Abrus precatorius TaxID=3816 RepID=A0A8B8L451_ABRPR|nr:uncharacterized protein LOC113862137 [Abrus precatorius]
MGSVHKDLNVFHFSHPHPLECTTSPSTGNVSCFGCKLKVKFGEDYYKCKTCAFYLHCVCYKTPLITNHPSHPRHDLVLVVIPSSPATKTTFNCMACGHHVMGFCYHCAECSIFFHSLCLALPLSLSITNHPHKIKLEFSPPYDFFCDLCNKPSFNGWLYRCNICEFDTHIACAVENLEQNPSFPQSSPLLRQLTSHQVDHKRISGSIGDSSTKYEYEIMRLAAQQIGGRIDKNTSQEDFDSAIAGWDKRIYSPRKKNNRSSTGSGKMKIIELELQETELSPANILANLEERTPLRDKLTPLSDHSSPTLSIQYSESCFSIDLTQSYSTHGRRNQVRGEGNSDHITTGAVMPDGILSNSRQIKEQFGVVNWPTNTNDAYSVAQHNKLNAAFFKTSDFGESSQKVMMKIPNESLAKETIKDQKITKSESVS